MINRRLTFVALSVSDLARSVHFYREILGIPLAACGPPYQGSQPGRSGFMYPTSTPHPDLPDEVQLLWYKDLSSSATAQRIARPQD